MKNLNEKITKNFTYGEMIKSSVASKLKINNVPSNNRIWKNLELLTINCLQKIREKFGALKITSGYRCQLLNTEIGGSPQSNHTRGQSADFKPYNNVSLIEILNYICKNIIFREIILEYPPGGWLHITYREGGNKQILKLKDANHNYSRVDISYINKLYK